MKPEKIARLQTIFDQVAQMQRQQVAAALIIERLQRDHAATYRFLGGTYILRCAGIAGTSTAGAGPALERWKRAVTMAIVKHNQGGFGGER